MAVQGDHLNILLLVNSYVIMVLRVVHAALRKRNIISNLIRTPDELGLVQGGSEA